MLSIYKGDFSWFYFQFTSLLPKSAKMGWDGEMWKLGQWQDWTAWAKFFSIINCVWKIQCNIQRNICRRVDRAKQKRKKVYLIFVEIGTLVLFGTNNCIFLSYSLLEKSYTCSLRALSKIEVLLCLFFICNLRTIIYQIYLSFFKFSEIFKNFPFLFKCSELQIHWPAVPEEICWSFWFLAFFILFFDYYKVDIVDDDENLWYCNNLRCMQMFNVVLKLVLSDWPINFRHLLTTQDIYKFCWTLYISTKGN